MHNAKLPTHLGTPQSSPHSSHLRPPCNLKQVSPLGVEGCAIAEHSHLLPLPICASLVYSKGTLVPHLAILCVLTFGHDGAGKPAHLHVQSEQTCYHYGFS